MNKANLTPIPGIAGAIIELGKYFLPKPTVGEKEPDVNTGHALGTEVPKKNPFHVHPDFPFSVQRDFSDDLLEVAIEVVHYRQPGNNKYLDHRDPNYEAGEVQFGDAVVVASGKTIELTPQEWEAAETAFWNTGSRDN